jgi:hypothetical protein
MTTMNKPAQVRDARDVERALRRGGCAIRNGKGSHRVATLPDGSALTYYDHGEYPPGTRRMLTNALLKAGLILLIWSIAGLVGALAASGFLGGAL